MKVENLFLLTLLLLISYGVCQFRQVEHRIYGKPVACKVNERLIGATYCHRYTDVKYTSDPAVKNWLLKTKGCFQQLLLDRINQEFPKPKEVPEICTMTDSFGFRTHTACLTNPQHNICNLSLAKIRLIVSAIPSTKTAWRGVTNAYEKMFRYQLKTVIVKHCGISEQLLKVQAPEILDP